jgi:putative glutamine amidotransferase
VARPARICLPARTARAGVAHRLGVAWGGERYLAALRRAGGEGLVVQPRPLVDGEAVELLSLFDGLVLMGGPDVDPALYGETPHDTVYGVNRLEDDFEAALLRAAIDNDVPVLAICRGMQLLAVTLGGSLDQHITGRDGVGDHAMAGFPRPEPGAIGPLHPIELEPGTRVAEAVSASTTTGSSSHHQAVRDLGDGLHATGRTADGIVEAVELARGWVVGVQWHPEDTAAEDPLQQRLFGALVAQARGRG